MSNIDDKVWKAADEYAKPYDYNPPYPSTRSPEYSMHFDGFIDGYEAGHAAALESTGWIDCKDRLPENLSLCNDAVLITNGRVITIGCYDYEDGWHGYDKSAFKNVMEKVVTHWMELPSLPPTSKP